MRITVFGAGYVGLVTAACLADVGHQVLCADVDVERVRTLDRGDVPIYEPGLKTMLARNREEGRLAFTTDAGQAVRFGTLLFIAVGTPAGENGAADLKHVLAVAAAIGEHIDGYRLVINKSTVPVGTADRVRAVIAEQGRADDFDVCSNPEFLKEGAAIEDFTRGARIVVGTESERARELMRECYGPYNWNRDKFIFMDTRSAELTKYAANTMLAIKISFMNEMANLAEHLGADIEQVRLGIGSDPRIGYHFIYPGCGYGGACFPKDIQALESMARDAGYPARILQAVEQVNRAQKDTLFAKLQKALEGDLAGKTIAVWGLAYKPNTDDMREAPSRALMEAVWAQGGRIQAYDPEAARECRRLYGQRPDLTLADDRYQALEGADALVICTEWKEFRVVDAAEITARLRRPLVIDGRNLYDPPVLRRAGIAYFAVGRGDSVQVFPASP